MQRKNNILKHYKRWGSMNILHLSCIKTEYQITIIRCGGCKPVYLHTKPSLHRCEKKPSVMWIARLKGCVFCQVYREWTRMLMTQSEASWASAGQKEVFVELFQGPLHGPDGQGPHVAQGAVDVVCHVGLRGLEGQPIPLPAHVIGPPGCLKGLLQQPLQHRNSINTAHWQ